MFGINPESEKEAVLYRKKAGELILKVLKGFTNVRVALLNFPKDVEDKSVKAAWHALCHLGADEELRARDSMYAEEQDIFLNSVAETLIDGNSLPQNIINAYKDYYEEPLTPHKKGIKGFFAEMKNFLVLKK